MSRTVTAFYDTKAEAEAARDRLSSEVDVEGRAKIIDKSSMAGDGGSSDFHNVPLSSDDRNAYSEGLNRGGFMLCAEVDEDEDADKIVSILEQTAGVDLDERQNAWRQDGWSGAEKQSASTNETGRVVEEERIPIVEEQLRVGKREVERGGKRVRTYVEERPVSESVTLREEHVDVTRRPVDQQISSADVSDKAFFQDRTVEMTEKSEEAVVAKDARVKEEVVIQKTADEHMENVEDTVRETKVDFDGDISSTVGSDRDRGTDRS